MLFEIALICIKTIINYVFLILILKLMGKREIGQLSTFDLVVFFVISELFSLSLNDAHSNILQSVIPILIIVLCQIITAKLSLKNYRFRKYMEGTPTFLIFQGKIDYKALYNNRYNIDDFLLLLRKQNVINPEEVEFALLENNGELNIILKKDNQYLDPLPLIQDGKLNQKTLKRNHLSKEKVERLIKEKGYSNIKEIYLLFLKINQVDIIPFKEN